MTRNEAKQLLLSRVIYDPRSPTCLTTIEGKQIGYLNTDGYYRITQDKVHFSIHLIVWEIHNGPIPDGYEIDHKDTDKSKNLIGNLRLATKSQNEANKKLARNNTTGIKGLSWDSCRNRWKGEIWLDGKSYKKQSVIKQKVEDWLLIKRTELHKEFAR